MNNRCFGFTRNCRLCSRKGDWSFFCADHKLQWIKWLIFLVFTVIAGSASIYSVAPSFLSKSDPEVQVPGSNNIERSIFMAKMEGVKFTTPSASKVVAKFFVRPTVTLSIDEDFSMFALVSVSPFKPKNSKIVFDAGDCRFLGYAIMFEPGSNKATFSVKTISCTNNENDAYSLEFADHKNSPVGLLSDLNEPTEMSISLDSDQEGFYSVPMFKNVLINFLEPIEELNYVGRTVDRF